MFAFLLTYHLFVVGFHRKKILGSYSGAHVRFIRLMIFT